MKSVNHKTTMCADERPCKCRMDVPVFDSRDLFGEFKEVRLQHCSDEYRLLLTKSNKLILTK
ncbi:MAG: hemin uptake protein HemP [Phycisphaerales bacterium]|nr:MAG: hemin uptake protein HemP [Phycisphaerales bacterium]UCF14234.1 MAG: hemin uptake protein HemP [Phycisphaerales bacterium]